MTEISSTNSLSPNTEKSLWASSIPISEIDLTSSQATFDAALNPPPPPPKVQVTILSGGTTKTLDVQPLPAGKNSGGSYIATIIDNVINACQDPDNPNVVTPGTYMIPLDGMIEGYENENVTISLEFTCGLYSITFNPIPTATQHPELQCSQAFAREIEIALSNRFPRDFEFFIRNNKKPEVLVQALSKDPAALSEVLTAHPMIFIELAKTHPEPVAQLLSKDPGILVKLPIERQENFIIQLMTTDPEILTKLLKERPTLVAQLRQQNPNLKCIYPLIFER
jgi:hypothetical protein